MRYNFAEVKRIRKVTLVCESCKKKRTRTINEWQTINPFNKNKDGYPKSEKEIVPELLEKLSKREKEMQSKPFFCSKCPAPTEE